MGGREAESAGVVAFSEPAEARLLGLVRDLLAEVRPGRQARRSLDLDSSLERDLALDSLARAELVSRVERSFAVQLPASTLGDAETPRDLLSAVARAHPGCPLPAAADALLSAEIGATTVAPAPRSTATLQAVLAWHAQHHPARTHLTFLGEDDTLAPLSYGTLARRSQQVASALRERGVAAGQAVALMLPSGLDYFAAFCGVLQAGAVPVPLYPPARRSQIEEHLRR
jgi:non-ribosomal peptide synthetase component F